MTVRPDPVASRPHMPGYGIEPDDGGRGLLPWSWAVDRLTRSHEYWVAAVGESSVPHLMPVWAVWFDDALWFSSSPGSRRARSLAANPHCAVATDDPHQPVVVEGQAERRADRGEVEVVADRSNDKYGTAYPVDFYLENAVFRVRPDVVLALDDSDFTGSPTRWLFS
jgi:nitroimidazol reductase NimA-like FMN-containing flavoprotein (pyridoxamine 5'-phosphate oxidase superfamily)